MRRKLILFLIMATAPLLAKADEGMWLVHSFRHTIYKEMKKAGLKVKEADFYNENAPALCDAVVAVDGGMGSGSIISDQGLMITNHHVAYGDIWALSTPENNYLEKGFWALEDRDELPVKGKTVTFLRKVVDITDEANQLKQEMIAESGKWGIMSPRRQFATLEKRHQEGTDYQVSCYSFFRGELYLMLYYEVFTDVRLVGAPPEFIGSFGGEKDNWGWPQHKGDFALYRVYADKDGKPADYSENNVPLRPEKFLNISTGGIKDGDFAMVIGYPGRTHRYSSSFHVTEKEKVSNPIVYSCRRAKLDVIREHMDRDPEVRLAYADQYTSVANYMDYARWESICLRRFGVAGIRAEEEAHIKEWIAADAARIAEFGDVIDRLGVGYPARREALTNQLYYREAWFGQSNAMTMGSRMKGFLGRIEKGKLEPVPVSMESSQDIRDIYRTFERFEGTSEYGTDKDLLKNMLKGFTRSVDRKLWGDILKDYYDRFAGNTDALGEYIYEASFCTTPERFAEFFSAPRTMEEIMADPIVQLNYTVAYPDFAEAVKRAEDAAGVNIAEDEPLYQRAVYAYRADKGIRQYPDANSSMRVTYGHVGPVRPSDAVCYESRSTVGGYTEKYDPDDRDFRTDERMRELIAARDWGRWAEKGTLYVNFLTDHDITGGNSGSPVLNARGDLIGLCFDGNRESMATDIYYHPTLNKGVNVDIRFVLWVIDKYAGASSLIDEMSLVK